jgi:surface antigen
MDARTRTLGLGRGRPTFQRIGSLLTTLLLAGLLAIGGCETRQETGRVVGGAAGAVAGSQVGDGATRVAAVLLGTALGAALGDRVGAWLDDEDEARAQNVLETNRTEETTSWTNPDTGADWAMTPTRTFEDGTRPCREFETVVRVEDEAHVVDGVACRNDDGEWEIYTS